MRRVLTFVVIALLTCAVVGYVRFERRRDRVYAPSLERSSKVRAAPSDAAAIARGDHIAHTLGGCASCHGEDLGGRVMDENAMIRVVAPNLTPGEGSAVVGYGDDDWLRAITHGIGRNGRSLLVMPSKELASFADADLAALIAYLRSLRSVDRRLAPSSVSTLGAVVFGLTNEPVLTAEETMPTEGPSQAALPHDAPPAGPTRAYGEYLTTICRGCHGPELRGGIVIHPGAPPSGDISPRAMAAWTYPELERALREGRKRDGRPLDPAMPWEVTRRLTDDEMRALWLGLRAE